MIPSACIARLISTYSGLKLQAIINAQIDEKIVWNGEIKFLKKSISKK